MRLLKISYSCPLFSHTKLYKVLDSKGETTDFVLPVFSRFLSYTGLLIVLFQTFVFVFQGAHDISKSPLGV